MKKLVTLCLVTVASFAVAGVASADVPSELTSTTACSCTPDPGGGAALTADPLDCTIGPAGNSPSEDINVNVVVRNVLGAPLAGSTVTVTPVAVSGATDLWCPGEAPQVAVSAADGSADFVFDDGSVLPVAYPSLDFDVTADGPGPGGPVSLNSCPTPLDVTTFDLDQTTTPLDITVVDFAIFASKFGTGDIDADFDHVPPVTVVDFAQFAAHFGDVCP